ncbi:MAG: primosomal protein [Ghiorsea sp.]
MLLITEVLEGTTKYTIDEAADGTKKLYIEGIFMQAEQKNKNGRVYPMNILESEVNRYRTEYINTNRALGELCHPASPQVNPERASHRITELTKSGSDFFGKALILNTPMGNIVRGLIEGGTHMGVSSRGLGTVKQNTKGINEVQSDFSLRAVDVVADPSAPSAFVNGIMEGISFGVSEIIVDKIQKQVRKIPSRRLEEEKLKIFKNIFQ